MNKNTKLVIFGSSGHAGDVADIAFDNGYREIIFLTLDKEIKTFCGFPVMIDTFQIVSRLQKDNCSFAIGVGDPKVRELIFNKYSSLNYPNLVHSTSTYGNLQNDDILQCRGVIISAGSRITNNVLIGDFCFLGVNSVVGHDCILDEFVSVMPSVCISGNVHLRKGSYVGCNASIRQGTIDKKLIIGRGTTVGMGAVVLDSIPDNHIATGVPSKSTLLALD